MERPLMVGIDVGLVNIGIAFYDVEKKEHYVFQTNPLLERDENGTWRNVEYEERCVFELVRKLDAEFETFFKHAHWCRIEKQMGSKFKVIGHCWETLIRVKYPEIDCAPLAAQTTRALLEKKYKVGMTAHSRGKRKCDYDDSKNASKRLCQKLLGVDAYKKCMVKFTKIASGRKVKKIDALEAMLINVACIPEENRAHIKKLSRRKLKFMPGEAANKEPIKAVRLRF